MLLKVWRNQISATFSKSTSELILQSLAVQSIPFYGIGWDDFEEL